MEEKGGKCAKTYSDTLDVISKQRYVDKLSLIGNQDPYTVEKQRWSLDIEKWAAVTYPDIVNFLLYTTSSYTLDELKSYKGLEAYNQFICGWVRDVKVMEINGLCVQSARVMHSQRLSETPLTPWAIIQKDGKVLAAHCNCMAGLGESCTHIAAMLFSIEATVKVRESKTVTQSKAYWLPMSVKGVEYAKLVDIDFSSAKSKKKVLDAHLNDTPLNKRGSMQHKLVDKPTETEISSFLSKLSLTGSQSAILSVKKEFQKPFVPKALDQRFPKVLTELLNNELLGASYSEIIKHCEELDVKVSQEEAESVEAATKLQSECKLWNRFRSGRVTASRMHAVCHSNPAAPSESLIRAICNPESTKFSSAATAWGCTHEQEARELYKKTIESLHDNFVIESAGFTLNPEYPLVGASPDALVSCDCCGQGVVEIKCPYCVKSSTLDMYTGTKSCLEQNGESKMLKRNHPYFYQVQTQIFVCSKEYADFIVWTEKEIHVERIEPDKDFWEQTVKKAMNFHSMAVMPELVGRFYSRLNKPATLTISNATSQNQNAEKVFCICRKEETDTMVACDNQNCPYQWFHLDCLKLTESKLPKGKWYCPDCSRMPEFRKKRRCLRK